ncbi:MAG TPA: hypothetical protein DCY88_14785 [Cyanobacteria bacterium UBA11372]|nr:hypothetical protein [Cyanobacteria bacterium UBA11372]
MAEQELPKATGFLLINRRGRQVEIYAETNAIGSCCVSPLSIEAVTELTLTIPALVAKGEQGILLAPQERVQKLNGF